MTFKHLLILLGLMGTVCSHPICEHDCKRTTRYCKPNFKQVFDLQNSSIAPWTIGVDHKHGRDPETIHYADCKTCNIEHMIAKPIIIQVRVYHMLRNGTDFPRCECTYDLAVGCTCVPVDIRTNSP